MADTLKKGRQASCSWTIAFCLCGDHSRFSNTVTAALTRLQAITCLLFVVEQQSSLSSLLKKSGQHKKQ